MLSQASKLPSVLSVTDTHSEPEATQLSSTPGDPLPLPARTPQAPFGYASQQLGAKDAAMFMDGLHHDDALSATLDI